MIYRHLIHFIIAIFIVVSCKNEHSDDPFDEVIENSESESDSETLIDWRDGDYRLDFPLDTLALIEEMNLIDHIDRTDLIASDPDSLLLSQKIDTLVMYHVTYGCICPDWYVTGCNDSLKTNFSGPCQFYMEPADDSLIITVPFHGANHAVRYIGKRILKDAEDGDYGEASHGGQRFKYYSFEFIRPYTIYGPLYNDTVFKDNGDTCLQTFRTHLLVK